MNLYITQKMDAVFDTITNFTFTKKKILDNLTSDDIIKL